MTLDTILLKSKVDIETLAKHLDLDKIFGESNELERADNLETNLDLTDFEIVESQEHSDGFDVSFTDFDGKISLAYFKTIKASESWIDMMMGTSDFVSDNTLTEYQSNLSGKHFYNNS
jgi:hypothetical protein|tara:strand:- start:103 stop:456 length:354 start_codon:yes stop_codon:yes gene_type:complete